ncbi:TetR/AcrR family transcriptional regulator [Nocardioides sp. Y6]|uniref:TetR/AcrR family transcriptional regulator n=1 Tax=Nocardioides malaquae TaxID=2773426 RepID=A0ABR9RRZ7_9ACTN|nr:TetR/AcrR family transcriptional regulator [Nocardioides malaquae]MBE7324343.1 TetR/AcrR family transcriptional regulator [Nocardioides malaquae]
MEQSSAAPAPRARSPRTATASRRRARTQEILAATRALFDERGLGEAQIEDVARAVGINRAIVYRHFSGKEELFALTLVTYLEELDAALAAVDAPEQPPAARLAQVVGAFVDFGVAHPAFVDCAQSLMRRTGTELLEEVSEDAALRLGRAMATPLGLLATILDAGRRTGDFHVDSPETVANLLYATGLGTLQLARVGLQVEHSGDHPVVRPITVAQTKEYLVHSAVALATYRPPQA